jgi:hypothetical protein
MCAPRCIWRLLTTWFNSSYAFSSRCGLQTVGPSLRRHQRRCGDLWWCWKGSPSNMVTSKFEMTSWHAIVCFTLWLTPSLAWCLSCYRYAQLGLGVPVSQFPCCSFAQIYQNSYRRPFKLIVAWGRSCSPPTRAALDRVSNFQLMERKSLYYCSVIVGRASNPWNVQSQACSRYILQRR